MRLLLLLTALVVASTASAATAPRVALDGLSPVVVVGSGFDTASPVRVTVATGETRLVKTVASTRAGTFRAAWSRTLHRQRCDTIVLSAVSATKRAAWKSVPSRTCAPPVPTP